MTSRLSKRTLLIVAALLVAVALGSGLAGAWLGKQYERNRTCCQVPMGRNILLTFKESVGLAQFPSQIGQDKWVSESVFPGVTNGFFVDVGSADGTIQSNTKALEAKGWTGLCVDPFPRNMQDRTCQMFKEVVFSEAGRHLTFKAASDIGGIVDTLGAWKDLAMKAKGVEFTTTTLADILERARAPQFIHFVSLDVEGAELEALKAFPFDRHQMGALAVEHNYEEPKRTEIEALMKSKGYRRSHTWQQDDFYVPHSKK